MDISYLCQTKKFHRDVHTMLTQKEIDFIVENAKADTAKLLVAVQKFQDINLRLCINCIESRRKLISKLPQWHAKTSLVYPFPSLLNSAVPRLPASTKGT